MSDEHVKSDAAAALEKRLATLPREVEPPRDLWAGIAERIADVEAIESPNENADTGAPISEVSAGRFSAWYGLAAAALFAVVTSLVTVNENADVPGGAVGVGALASFETEAFGGPERAAELLRVRQDLHQVFRQALEELAPETRTVVIDNLTRIELARAEIDAALKDDPQNQLLQQLLMNSYANELSMLNEFAGMTRSAAQRTAL